MRRTTLLALTPLAWFAMLGCATEEAPPAGPPATPGEAAVAALALDPSTEDDVDALFGTDLTEPDRAALLDALSEVRSSVGEATPAVTATEPLPGDGVTVVDLEVALATDAVAVYSFRVEPADPGFRITWFQGPGVSWPPDARRRGEGLTTSATPDGDEVRR